MIDSEVIPTQNTAVIHTDVTDESSCQAAVARTVELFGTVHILVNIVGVGGAMGDATKVDMAAWDRDFKINVTSLVLMSRYAIPEMRKNGRGAIVNLSSVSGCQYMQRMPIVLLHRANGCLPVLGGNPSLLYPTTKGAIIQMTRAMAAQHGQENIRVNCVAPGNIATGKADTQSDTDQVQAWSTHPWSVAVA
jgi:NAD(P)-dependent dehydrogenase (short-subunit alcohol dehydrogenase family)